MEGFYRLLRKHRVELAALGALILLAAVATPVLQTVLESTTSGLKVEAVAAVERALDSDIQYRSISPSVFLYLEIRDLSIAPHAGAAFPAVRVSRVRVYYSLLRLLAGSGPAAAVTRIDIRDTSFDLGDLDHFGAPGGPAGTGFRIPALPAALEVTGTNLSLRFVVDEARVSVQRLFFRARRSADQVGLQVTRAAVAVEQPGLSLRAQIRLTGRTRTDFSDVDAVLRVDGLRSQVLALSRQSFQIQREGGSLLVRRMGDKAPLDLQISSDGVRASLAVRTDRYNPRSFVTFLGPLAFLNEYTRASVTTTLRVDYLIDQGAVRYTADIEAAVGGRLLPPGTVVQAKLQGDERLMRLDPLAVTSPKGDLHFEGDLQLADLLPEGLLRLSGLTAFADKRVDADVDLTRGERTVVLTGRRFEVDGTPFNGLRLALTPRPGSLQFELQTAAARPDRGVPGLTASGILNMRPAPSLEASAQVRAVPLSIIAGIAPLPAGGLSRMYPALADLVVDAGISVRTDFRAARVEATRIALADSVDPRNAATLSLLYDSGRLSVSDARVAWGGHTASGSLAMRNGPASTAFESSLVIDGLPYELEGTWDPSLGLIARGSYGLRIGVHPLDGSYLVSVAARGLPFPGLSRPAARLDVDMEGTWRSPGFWEVRVPRLVLDGLSYGAGGAGRFEASFTAGPRLVTVNRIAFRDRLGEVTNSRPAAFALQDSLKGSIELASPTSGERYSLTLSLGQKSFAADLRMQELPLERIAPGALTGDANGRITASGPYASPAVNASVRLADGRLGGRPLTLTLEAGYSEGRLAVTSLEAAIPSYRIGATSASYETATGRFAVETSLSSEPLEPVAAKTTPMASRIRLSGRIRSGPGLSLWRSLFRGELQGLAAVSQPKANTDAPPSWTMAFSIADDVLRFDGGPADSVHGRVTENGEYDVSLAQPLPIRGHAVGRFMTDDPETRIEGLEVDMTWLSSFLKDFSFARGTARSVGDVLLLGPLSDPRWQGRLDVQGVQMGFYMSPVVSSPFEATITLRDRDLVLEPTRATVGPGDLAASGVIGFSHWNPTNYDLQFQGGGGGLHTVHDFGTVAVDGYASGVIRVQGDDLAIRVTGDLNVDYCKLTVVETATPQKNEGSDRTSLFVDLQLTAGRRVEFLWPSVNFPVLRASARSGSRLRIQHAGDVQQTRVTGRVALRGGDVFYINRSFYIKEGELAFNETEQRFDPRLTLRGEIREQDRTGQDVRIYLVVDDRRLSEFAPRFESDPPKSEVEIIALLGGPIEDQLVQSGLAGSAVLVSSDIISHFGLLRPFEQGVRDLLGLDLFSIRTQMIQNVVVDRVLGIEPAVTEPTVDPLGRYLDNTTVTFGKYIGKDLFLEMDLRVTEKQTTGVDTEVLFSLDWPTPLFDLEWQVSPGGGDVESFVREKTRLSITWRYSY